MYPRPDRDVPLPRKNELTDGLHEQRMTRKADASFIPNWQEYVCQLGSRKERAHRVLRGREYSGTSQPERKREKDYHSPA